MSVVINGTSGISGVDGSAGTPAIQGGDTNTGMFFPAADTIAFAEGGAEVMRIDSSGNLGLGVTPSAWGTTKAFQYPGGSIGGYTNGSNNNQSIMLGNAYFGASGGVYINSDYASYYRQYSGTHAWFTAPSGTAGNAITFTQAMTLDASGNVGIGSTSPSRKLYVQSDDSSTGGNVVAVRNANTTAGAFINFIGGGSNAPSIGAKNNALVFTADGYAGTEWARIDSSGNLLFNSGYGSVATAYGCRAWVNFNGTGTVAIRASGNVSSITDNGVGDYTVNFTTAMPDVNYAWSAGGSDQSNTFANNDTPTYKSNTSVQLTTSLRINTFFNSRPSGTQYSNGVADMALITLQVFR